MSAPSAEPEPQLQSPPPSPHHRRLRLLRRHPSAFLLAAQLASLLVYGAIDDTRTGRWLFGAIAAVVVPLTVWVVNRTPAVTRVAWLLAIPAMLLTAIASPPTAIAGWPCRPCWKRCCTSMPPPA